MKHIVELYMTTLFLIVLMGMYFSNAHTSPAEENAALECTQTHLQKNVYLLGYNQE